MWFADHPVATAGIVAGVLVLAALGYAGWRGLQVWRLFKAVRSDLMQRVGALQAETGRIEQGLSGLAGRQAEIDAAIKSLAPRVAVLKVLADHAGQAVKTAKAPLKLIGR